MKYYKLGKWKFTDVLTALRPQAYFSQRPGHVQYFSCQWYGFEFESEYIWLF